MKTKIRITLDELEAMVERMRNEQKHNSMTGMVIVTLEKHSNGRGYIQFEQPCGYGECNSHYERFTESERDFVRRTAE